MNLIKSRSLVSQSVSQTLEKTLIRNVKLLRHSYIIPVVRVPMIIVVLMANLRPRFLLPVPTAPRRWSAIIIQMVRMAMVGMMNARLAAVHTQAFLK